MFHTRLKQKVRPYTRRSTHGQHNEVFPGTQIHPCTIPPPLVESSSTGDSPPLEYVFLQEDAGWWFVIQSNEI